MKITAVITEKVANTESKCDLSVEWDATEAFPMQPFDLIAAVVERIKGDKEAAKPLRNS